MGEGYLRCGNAVTFDVRWQMLVMRESWRQRRIIGMWKVIVPIQPFFVPIQFIAVRGDQFCIEIEFFPQTEPDAVGEEDFSLGYACVRTVRPDGHCGTLYCGTVEQFGHEMTVAGQCFQWVVAHSQ